MSCVEICKRIRGTPGDKVQYRQHRATDPVLVSLSDGMYWLAGDNPRNSLDSRSYGPVPRSRILGRATHRLSLGFPFVKRIDAQVPASTLEEERRILERWRGDP